MTKYNHLSKEELLEIIVKQENELKKNKYGLVWDSEREPEQVVLDCENHLPVLEKVKEIKTDETEDNILIEGDNYHALTCLNYTHKEKIDIIYIDPPYNTKQEGFIYNDRIVNENDGYRHSKWLNFMEKRLVLAKNLLKKNGVIFISIDDNELCQLKLLCDKIFSENSFVGILTWEKKKKGSHLDKTVTNIKEYILVYSIEKDYFEGLIAEVTTKRETYPCINPGNTISKRVFKKGIKSKFKQKNYILQKGEIISAGNMSLVLHSDLILENGELKEDLIVESEWRYSQEKLNEYMADDLIYLTNKLYFRRIVEEPRLKKLKDILPRVENNRKTELLEEMIEKIRNKEDDELERLEKELEDIESQNYLYSDFNNLYNDGWGSNEDGDNELRDIFGKKVFDYPKPSKLIAKLIASIRKEDVTVLDFFAGSGTTAQAVLELNKSLGGNRKYILCTNNENNICNDITFPRIEKIIKGYKKRNNGDFIKGYSGNLQYLKTKLIQKTNNKDQTKINLTQECTYMLCLKENIFNPIKEKTDYKIFSSNSNSKFLCIYYNFFDDSFDEFINEIRKLNGEKKIYIFSLEDRISKSLFKGIKNFTIETIPQKILDIYKQLVKLNIPIKPEIIFIEFNKAKDRIFLQKDKDEGARSLRIVLEKLLQKIAQNNGISILNSKGSVEKIAIINDLLKKHKVINQVLWEENKTFLTIGNHAAHGEYEEYNIKKVENFYKYIQSLLNTYIVKGGANE